MHSLESLRPPPSALLIKHDDHYIKHLSGKKMTRSVFMNVPYDQSENQQIETVEMELKQKGVELPHNWSRAHTLRFIYQGDFNTQNIIKNILQHIEWRNNSILHELTPVAVQCLTKGAVYQFGRDSQHRPIFYIEIPKVSTDVNQLQPFLTAVCCLLQIVTTHMCIPYHVERIRIIVDSSNVNVYKICSYHKIIEVTQKNYCGLLESMYILDPPFIFVAASKLISGFLHPDTLACIRILSKSQFSAMHEFIPPHHLQIKHGGTHPNLTQFWPITIVDAVEQTVYYSMHDSGEPQQIQIDYIPQDTQCQCNIM